MSRQAQTQAKCTSTRHTFHKDDGSIVEADVIEVPKAQWPSHPASLDTSWSAVPLGRLVRAMRITF